MRCRPQVALCSGKDCRKRDEYRLLRDTVAAVAEVRTTKCLDVCDSPVVVIRRPGVEPVVIDKVRTADERDAVVAVIRGTDPSGVLGRRVVRGKARRRAIAKSA